MRFARLLPIVCAAAVCAGCLTSSAVIHVNPDGSGTITNTVLMKAAAMEMLKTMPSGEAEKEEKKDSTSPFFNEEKLRAELPRMGEGVTFVSVQPLKQPNWEGAKMTFAFKDISKVRFNLRSEMMEAGGDPEVVTFRFTRAAGGAPSKLTILMPQPNLDKAKAAAEAEAQKMPDLAKEDSALAKAMLEQFKLMFDGMRLSVAVDVGGPVVRTNAEHVSGSTITLFDMDMSEMLKTGFNDMEAFDSISRGGMTMTEAREKLKLVKGLKMALQPELSVEFGAR
jgi:hypothetical protein